MSRRSTYRPYVVQALPSRRLPPAGERYFRFAARETCLVRDEPWMRWLVDHGSAGIIDIPNGRIYDYYLEEKSSLRVLKKIVHRIQRNWTRHISQYPTRSREVIAAARSLSHNPTQASPATLTKRFLRYTRAMNDFGDYIWCAWAVIYHIEPELSRKIPHSLDAILALDRPIAYQRFQRDLNRLPLTTLASRYGWLNVYNPYDRPYTSAQLRTNKRHTDRKTVDRNFRGFAVARKRFRATLKQIPAQYRRPAEMAHAYAFLKTDRVDVWRRAMDALRPFYLHLVKRIPNAKLRDATNLSQQETVELLRTGRAPELRELKLRSANRALFVFRRRIIATSSDRRLISSTLNRLQARETTQRILKGVPASPGHATGRVRVITHSEDVHQVRAGDVFVAKYTFPSYTPTMRKCVAIVADEGGLTGHAAVVSREFGIPCVVGTGNATRVLKNGDLVEVDATKGVVRKLNRQTPKPPNP